MTNQADPCILWYLNDLKGTSLLTADEEKTLGKEIRLGNKEARSELISRNLRLVIKLAAAFQGRGLSLADLIEEGNLGLIRAVKDFNPDLNLRFSTYAAWWIKESIRRALHDTARTVRIPAYMDDLLSLWKSKEQELRCSLNRVPSAEELAEELKLSEEKKCLVKRALNISKVRTVSACSGLDDSRSFYDVVEDKRIPQPEKQLFDKIDKEKLWGFLKGLSKREFLILKLRFGLENRTPLTLKEIGKKLGLTRERVRQIERKAIKMLSVFYKEKTGRVLSA